MSGPRALPRLVLITDWTLPRPRMEAVLAQVLPLGPTVAVQHRHPGAPVRRFLEEARWLAARCAPAGNPLFINERLDVALTLGAHLHLPAHGVSPAEARPLLPPPRWVSVAVHTPEEARRAQGADLALVSPVFAPGSKPGDTRAPLGWDGFHLLSARLPCPAYALGGITPERLARGARVTGAAVVQAVWGADDPRAAAERLLAALQPESR